MVKAQDFMSKSEKVIRYDVVCRDEGGDIKKDTVLADSSVLIKEFTRYWVMSFSKDLLNEHPDMTIEISGPTENLVLVYKDGQLSGGNKPKVQSKEMIEKYGECFDEKFLSDSRKKLGLEEFTQDEIDAVEGLMRDEKTLSYTISCESVKNKKIAKKGSILASEWMSPVDVLRFWIEQNSKEMPSSCTASISLKGKEMARIDYNSATF